MMEKLNIEFSGHMARVHDSKFYKKTKCVIPCMLISSQNGANLQTQQDNLLFWGSNLANHCILCCLHSKNLLASIPMHFSTFWNHPEHVLCNFGHTGTISLCS